MNQYLYRIQPTRPAMLTEGPTEQEVAIIDAHFAYLEGLVAQNVVFLAGRTQTADADAFGITVFAAANDEEAVTIMLNDPAVNEGVMKSQIFPFKIALWSAAGPGE